MSAAKSGVWPIVSISGPPGCGKSSLCQSLADQVEGATIVAWDDYETMTTNSPDWVAGWIKRGAPYDEMLTPGLVEALQFAANKGPVLFDTPVGRTHPQTGPLIDYAFWLACPADIALARKVKQLSLHASTVENDAPRLFLGWLQGYLAAYEEITHAACEIQVARVLPTVDHTLDAVQPVQFLSKCLLSDYKISFDLK